MARSLWIGTLLVALASAWLARGEPAGSPTPAANTGERLITVQEGDKPAQKCRVLKTWKTPEGNQALQVQAVDTGEMMTIIEEGPAVPTGSGLTGRVRTMTTRIFHWGPHKTPPPGVPMPPPTATVQSPPAAPGSGSPVAQAPMTGLVAPKPVVASSPRREWPS
ncbi:MAG TPA: hypothetical protein VNK04_25370, partial [Gemmataceae bacterium]|nr:hypothetical protein [Gemmataceae bacterium]